MAENSHELIIVGGGPAGLSAAMWAGELGIDAILLEGTREPGGQLNRIHNRIDNHLGASASNGKDLREQFVDQLSSRDLRILFNSNVLAVDPNTRSLELDDGKRFGFKYLLYATGVSRRSLEIPGELRLAGKGILESGKNQATETAGKTAVVVGGGDAAFENALILKEHAKDVILIHRRSGFSARREFVEAVSNAPKIALVTDTSVREILGQNKVEGILVENRISQNTTVIPADFLVVRIGVTPNISPLRDIVDLDEKGYIAVDSTCETNVDGIYAAGDIAGPLSPTVSSAVGMGATAVKSILSKLR